MWPRWIGKDIANTKRKRVMNGISLVQNISLFCMNGYFIHTNAQYR